MSWLRGVEEKTVVLLEKMVQLGIQLLCSGGSLNKLSVGTLGPFIALTGQVYEGLIIVPSNDFLLGYEFVPGKAGMCLKSLKYEGGISTIHLTDGEQGNVTRYELHSSRSTLNKVPANIFLETILFKKYRDIASQKS